MQTRCSYLVAIEQRKNGVKSHQNYYYVNNPLVVCFANINWDMDFISVTIGLSDKDGLIISYDKSKNKPLNRDFVIQYAENLQDTLNCGERKHFKTTNQLFNYLRPLVDYNARVRFKNAD